MNPSVTCIVLNWNGESVIESCLTAILNSDYDDLRVVLVDNASTDRSLEIVAAAFPSVEIVENRTNLGFAGGNNVILKELQSEIAILINPDVVIADQLIGDLAKDFDADERIGIVGCKTYYPGTRKIQHAGGTISFPRAEPDHFHFGEEEDSTDSAAESEVTDVEYVTGAIFAVKKALLEDIGFFDSGYFLYFEEADLCLRARKNGYRVVLSSKGRAEHEESLVTDKDSQFFHKQLHASRWRYLVKHYSIEDLINETFPAEAAWLRKLNPFIRSAAAYAYQHTLMTLPEIIRRRQIDGGDALLLEQRMAVAEQLQTLRQIAWELGSPSKADIAQLLERAELQETAFHSRLPIVSPAVSRIRDLWNRVAAKPFTDALVHQQNAINKANAQSIEYAWKERMNRDQNQLEMEVRLSELIQELEKASTRLEQLTEQLEILEDETKQRERA